MTQAEITVVGMGYVGMTAALALAHAGYDVACVGDVSTGERKDTRSTALFPESVSLLRQLEIWSELDAVTRPLVGIRIVDETGTLFRAPEITFKAADCGLEALAINVPNQHLHRTLSDLVSNHPAITRVDGTAAISVDHSAAGITVTTDTGERVNCPTLVAADGRNSMARAAAGIGTKAWAYDQMAVACTLSHEVSHGDVSTEYHRQNGPLTVVPGASDDDQHRSHLVWIERPSTAEAVAALPDTAFRNRLEEELQGLLGEISGVGPRGTFPIRGQTATSFAARNTFLVGETAHVIPPIGAQGMNLGLRDVAGLISALEVHSQSQGRGSPSAQIALYNNDRKNDVWMRTTAVDLLNRSLTTPYWPAQALRGAGLHLLNAVPPLKRAAIRAGFGD